MTRPAARPASPNVGVPAGKLAVAAVLFAILVATAGLAVACGGDDERPTATASTEPTARAAPSADAIARWAIDDAGGRLEIDAGTYRLTIADDGQVSYRPSGPDAGVHTARIFVVRDGRRHEVTSVDHAKLGLDHVTLETSFDDGTTARVELGADAGDVVAVRIAPDEPIGVTDRGLDLPSELVSYR